LRQSIEQLAQVPAQGQQLSFRKDLRYALIRKKHKGYGYVVIYTNTSEEFHVQYLFHSSQNWQEIIEQENA
jgi:plasmid stabilization system protein ParE